MFQLFYMLGIRVNAFANLFYFIAAIPDWPSSSFSISESGA